MHHSRTSFTEMVRPTYNIFPHRSNIFSRIPILHLHLKWDSPFPSITHANQSPVISIINIVGLVTLAVSTPHSYFSSSYWSPNQQGGLAVSLTRIHRVLHSIFSVRLILNMRKAVASTQRSEEDTVKLSAIVFNSGLEGPLDVSGCLDSEAVTVRSEDADGCTHVDAEHLGFR